MVGIAVDRAIQPKARPVIQPSAETFRVVTFSSIMVNRVADIYSPGLLAGSVNYVDGVATV